MRFLATAGLVMILAGLGAYYATNQLSIFSIANLMTGPLLLLTAGVVELRRFRGFTGAPSRRVALRWAVIGSSVLTLCITLNLLGRSWDQSIDLTVERLYSLSDQTLTLCKSLGTEPGASSTELLFFEDTLLAKDVRLLVQAYRRACPGLSVRELHSADAPAHARAVLASYETTVVVCQGKRCEPTGYPSEQNLSNALLRLGRKQRIEVHFLVGHGEANLASQGDRGFSGVTASLRDEGIELAALVGPSVREVPPEVTVLMVAAPERDLLTPELEMLERYLEGGGRLLVLLEPGRRTNLSTLLERWGFGLPAGVLADPRSSPLLQDPKPVSLLLRAYNPHHPVTRKLSNRSMLLMPGARAVWPAHKPRPQDKLEGLVFTSRSAWLESDVRAALTGRSIAADAAEPRGQELPVAAAGRYPREAGEARIVVIGDRDFASNRLLATLYNRDFLMNAVLWLAEDETRLAIRPKAWTPDQDPLTLQATLAYFYFLAFALPEMLLLLGINAWYRQRGS